MNEYKEMYLKLFRAHTKAIVILQKAQQEAEEIYMGREEDEELAELGFVTEAQKPKNKMSRRENVD